MIIKDITIIIKEIHERIKGITSKWEKGEYEEILKKYEGKRKRWYDILQEVYSIRKKKRIEKMQVEFKERTKGWEEDIQAIETEIKSRNPIKELQKNIKKLEEEIKENQAKRMEEEQAISDEMMEKAKEIVRKEFEKEIENLKKEIKKVQTNYNEKKKENEKLTEENIKLQGEINEIEGKSWK
ncbi:hypothetical protein ENUP19_0055G0053 [Entamoeba nuttalli]|uniref:Uncharacterized protein n=1 Tax=Entamoeba nuttalli TaxID=412467 RepID=A0ABQ0DCL0_9EUKA